MDISKQAVSHATAPHAQTHPQPNQHKRVSSNRGVYILGGVVAMCLGVTLFGLGFFVGSIAKDGDPILTKPATKKSPTQTSTKALAPINQWKTFTNAYSGITLQYPSSLRFVEDPYGITNAYSGKKQDPLIFIQGDSKTASNKDLIDIARADFQANQTAGTTTSELQETTFAGEKAYTFTLTGKGFTFGNGGGTVLEKGNYVVIETEHNHGDFLIIFKDSTEIQGVMTTFRFLDTNLSASPTCRPRPACLDSTPRCLIAETADMCPKTTQ